jgi:hypothetical protein
MKFGGAGRVIQTPTLRARHFLRKEIDASGVSSRVGQAVD